ncbi:hypothetical protein DespoDRAFT_00001 [Desulfobacter postgatei 2ac9]|uniref:Uncharacterized protein n=1 Tax=Desulfobacter postgatei 2ac9 TaxID=879212 RepID=I5AXV6_9BACT|nr:hypothetical protein DespoDRAFT_00001 [Desulfobacter postgatei 2ac9]
MTNGEKKPVKENPVEKPKKRPETVNYVKKTTQKGKIKKR